MWKSPGENSTQSTLLISEECWHLHSHQFILETKTNSTWWNALKHSWVCSLCYKVCGHKVLKFDFDPTFDRAQWRWTCGPVLSRTNTQVFLIRAAGTSSCWVWPLTFSEFLMTISPGIIAGKSQDEFKSHATDQTADLMVRRCEACDCLLTENGMMGNWGHVGARQEFVNTAFGAVQSDKESVAESIFSLSSVIYDWQRFVNRPVWAVFLNLGVGAPCGVAWDPKGVPWNV